MFHSIQNNLLRYNSPYRKITQFEKQKTHKHVKSKRTYAENITKNKTQFIGGDCENEICIFIGVEKL